MLTEAGKALYPALPILLRDGREHIKPHTGGGPPQARFAGRFNFLPRDCWHHGSDDLRSGLAGVELSITTIERAESSIPVVLTATMP